jgi:hypothetical protein
MAHNAVGSKIGTTPIRDAVLANRLRTYLKATSSEGFPLIESLEKKTLRDAIVTFLDGDSADIRPICSAYRHLVAHGHFTPWGAEVHTRRRQDCLLAIRDRLLAEGDNLLDRHYQDLTAAY